MDVRQLKYFVTIVDCGSLSKAADKLFVAQPSLSQQMLALEVELKTKLLLRSHQGVVPTNAGALLYRQARVVLRQMDQIRQEVTEGGGSEAGTVAVGLPTTIAAVLAGPLFMRVRERFPGIRLQIVESLSGYISELLADGRLDLALLFRDSETRGISVVPLFDEELYLMGEGGLKLADDEAACPLQLLANVPLVTVSAANGLRLVIERTFSRENVELNIVADIDSLPTLISLAKAGAAGTILPASALAQREPASRPRMRRIVDPVMSRPASICWSNSVPTNPAAIAVKQTIIELINQLREQGEWVGITLRPRAEPPATQSGISPSNAHVR